MANEPLFNPGLPAIEEVPPVEPIEPVAPVTAADEPPVVDPPAAEPITEEVPATPPATVEVIKEVEKIVEKYPEMDEYTGELFNALMEGKEDVLLNYLSQKHKDYKTMSDYDVVKANLLKTNPAYTDEIAELKIRRQYGDIHKIDLNSISQEDEPEQYANAVVHNKKVDENVELLKLDAFDARLNLEASKKDIKLPKIKQDAAPVVQPTAEELEQGRLNWEAMVEKEMPEVKEFTFRVGDDANGYEDVAYVVTDKERKDETAFMKALNTQAMFERLEWVDKTGKQNVAKMAGDALLLKNIKTLISTAYTQGRTAGAKDIKAEIKNLDMSANNSSSVATNPVDIGVLGFGHLNPK